jgi:hypothetical protein
MKGFLPNVRKMQFLVRNCGASRGVKNLVDHVYPQFESIPLPPLGAWVALAADVIFVRSRTAESIASEDLALCVCVSSSPSLLSRLWW